MGASRCGRRGRAVRRRSRAPGARAVLLRLALRRPELLDRVEDLPAELDLLVAGEQRRIAEQHVEDEALVGLGARLGEGVAVAEVHRHVAHLHAGAGHLRAEPDGDALVGLHADDEGVLAERRGLALGEQVLRRALEDDGDLGDAAAEALAGAQVERHAGPAAGVDVEPDRRVGLGESTPGSCRLLRGSRGPSRRPASRPRTGRARSRVARSFGQRAPRRAPSPSRRAGRRRRTRPAPPSR